ncbi:MAG TPA: hypothetical protein VHH36_02890, partial [Candidatus Thermoplasmatota archaeon]|nr:hypothetical protein [Candidatus Thermoplasmatota archaeon]
QYVHRAGRTARAGRGGRVFTFITENDAAHAKAAERAAGLRLTPYTLEVVVDGEAVRLTRTEPTPPRVEMKGGNARGSKRKVAPTPPKPVKVEELAEEPEGGPEFDLPPSRRRRDE